MIPNVSTILEGVRSALGDTEVPGGQVWADGLLIDHFARSYEVLFNYLNLNDSKLLRRSGFYNLAAYQTKLLPAQAGLSNFGSPKDVWEREIGKEYTITGVTPHATSFYCDLASAATTLANGDLALVYGVGGISDDINGEWGVSIVSPTSTRLLGCAATGTFTSGGTLTTGATDWDPRPMTPVRDTADFQLPPTGSPHLGMWAWVNGYLVFPKVSSGSRRQIKLVYELSGTAPTESGASVGIDDSAGFLIEHTAGRALAAKGVASGAAPFFIRSTGNPQGEPGDGSGGLLGQLVKREVKSQQKTQRTILARFRPKRNLWINRY